MRRYGLVLWLFGAVAAQAAPATPPYEITRDHVDVEVAADGSYADTREVSYRVLNAQGQELLHESRLGYTQGFETLDIVAAYTLKADGRRIDVPRNSYLSGFGQTSTPGFQDTHVLSLFYPNVEVGDQVVLITVHRQLVPWFAAHFDWRSNFSRAVISHDVRYAVTAPETMPLKIDALGLDGGVEGSEAGKKRWVWEFHNDAPVTLERDAVSEADFAPHLGLTSFAGYAEVARAYYDRSHDRAAVTPAIQALADDLTKGVADQRAQAKVLYDWVSSHIGYVEIVLGAGGFTPHAAQDVLTNRFGDCKDHVVLLEALLTAKGIDSTAVLIDGGRSSYKLPEGATPHAFDHAITYLPAFDLYLDSTAQLAPFGVLPYGDTGKPVLRVATGEVSRTPVANSATSKVRSSVTVDIKPDGSAQANAAVTSTGAFGVSIRALVQSLPAGKENDFLRGELGPGVEGTIDRGDPRLLNEPYTFDVSYRIPSAIALPGPGALPYYLSFKPFNFTGLIAGTLPAARNSDYVCLSLDAEENATINLPPGMRLLSIPDPQSLEADGVRMQIEIDRVDARTLKESYVLKIDHPQEVCTPAYYARVHAALAKMTNALREEVIYKGAAESAQ
jgi:transglutaminase-like putative cysteine protease